jgi:hypothetical protein
MYKQWLTMYRWTLETYSMNERVFGHLWKITGSAIVFIQAVLQSAFQNKLKFAFSRNEYIVLCDFMEHNFFILQDGVVMSLE